MLNERREVLVVQEKNGPLRGQAQARLGRPITCACISSALCFRQQLCDKC